MNAGDERSARSGWNHIVRRWGGMGRLGLFWIDQELICVSLKLRR